MEIIINNEKKNTDQSHLNGLIISILGDKTKGIAVALNEQVIPKQKWPLIELKPLDSVLIIKATQGG